MLEFEDFWPVSLDLDFNDVVLAYNADLKLAADGRVVGLGMTFNTFAAGGRIDHGFGLHLPAPSTQPAILLVQVDNGPQMPLLPSLADAELTFDVFNDLRAVLFPGAMSGQIINAVPGNPYVQGLPFVVEVTFLSPVTLATAPAPFDSSCSARTTAATRSTCRATAARRP